jgi:hypothetical protein
MKIFWTSLFWIVVFFLVVFYLKTFDDTMGTKVATWLSPAPIVASGELLSGAVDPVLSGLDTIQTNLETMQQTMSDIATKLGVTTIVTSGVVAPAVITTGTTSVKTK